MTRQQIIDNCINERKGIPPEGASLLKICGHELTLNDFKHRARELGWCNGYKYGVEYETNGNKPDLPDGVEIEHSVYGNFEEKVKAGLIVNWSRIDKFRIVDERYKPVEQSWAGEPSVDGGIVRPMHDGEGNKVFKADMSSSHWYDYDKQQAIALPQVSEQCEWKGLRSGKWVACEVIDKYQDKEMVVFNIGEYRNCRFEILQLDSVEFRPLDWNRKAEAEKREFVEAAIKTVKSKHPAPDTVYENYAIALYESGLFELKNKAASVTRFEYSRERPDEQHVAMFALMPDQYAELIIKNKAP